MKLNKLLIITILLILSTLTLASAQQEDIPSNIKLTLLNPQTAAETCSGVTNTIRVQIENLGESQDVFSINLEGDAAQWSVVAPQGFLLGAGQKKDVYIYVSPSVLAREGPYDLRLIADSGEERTEKLIKLNIKNCHTAILSGEEFQESCAGVTTKFDLTIANKGKFADNFKLSLSGNLAEFSKLTADEIPLKEDESAPFTIYATPPVEKPGTYTLVILVKNQYNAVEQKQLVLKANPCYDYELITTKAPEGVYEVCEGGKLEIPINIENLGTIKNSFSLSVEGPKWVDLSSKVINELAVDATTRVDLIALPPLRTKGVFPVTVQAETKTGKLVKSEKLSLNILACYDSDLKFLDQSDTICACQQKSFAFSLKNNGKFDENYVIRVQGPDWALVEEPIAKLKSGEARKINLNVDLPCDLKSEQYDIEVGAVSQQAIRSITKDALRLSVVSKDACFNVKATAQQKEVDVFTNPYTGSSALIPITVENRGQEDATYTLDISGNGAALSQLNPASIQIQKGKSEVVFLYIAPGEETELGTYTATVSARVEDDQTIQSSDTVKINVKQQSESTTTTPVTQPETQQPSKEVQAQEEQPQIKAQNLFSTISSGISNVVRNIGAGVIAVVGRIALPEQLQEYWLYIVIGVVALIIIIILWATGLLKKAWEFFAEEEEPKQRKRRPSPVKSVEEVIEGKSKQEKQEDTQKSKISGNIQQDVKKKRGRTKKVE